MGSLKLKKGTGTSTDGLRLVPSCVHVDHKRNFSRADIHPVPDELKPHIEGDTFCFTLAEVETRLAEFLRDGEQITPGTVYLTGTGDAFLVDGYLRHAAWLLAEVRGELKKTNVFMATKVPHPKTPKAWAALRRRNFSENNTRKKLTPIDRATYAQRLMVPAPDGEALSKEDTACELGFSSTRQLDRYLSLLALPPDKQGAVHRGDVTMSAALKKSSKTGEGTGKGERKGVKHSALKRAVDNIKTRPSPKDPLDAKQLVILAQRLSGALEESEDNAVEEWITWLNADKGVKPPKLRAHKPATT